MSAPLGENGTDSDDLHKLYSAGGVSNGDDDEENVAFDSPAEEARFYREKYRVAVDLLNETRAELDEFQISSRELEQELESELEVTEARQTELRERAQRLEVERDEWKDKFVNLQKSNSSTVAAMQREMDNLRSERDKTLAAIRDLEMGNDELERNERVAASSLLDMEIKYNRAIEEKTLLEQEVIQNQEVGEECQRLKDDIRDANNEIAILRDQLARTAIPTPPASSAHVASLDEFGSFSRTSYVSSRTESPTPSDVSGTTDASRYSNRSDRSTTVTPRTVHASPRVPRTSAIPTLSPSVKRTPVGTNSPSGIPRSSTTRNLSTATAAPGPSRRVVSTTSQTTRNKGFKLLHDLQARLKATDDKIGRNVKRNVSGPTQNRPSVTPAAPSAATLPRHPAAPQTTTTPTANGVFSPSSWVILSDFEDTPPARTGGARREPSSPLDATRPNVGTKTTSRLLPARPAIPSPLAPALPRTQRGLSASTSAAPTRPLRNASRPSGRPPLSASTSRPSSNLSSSTSRPSSRSHMRVGSRSGAMSPSQIPKSRRSSLSSSLLGSAETLSSPPRSATSASSRLSASSSRPASRSDNYSQSTVSRFTGLGRGPAPITPSARRAPRRSSTGVELPGAPPSGIPGPRTPASRPSSVPVFTDTPPPPVPCVPSALAQKRRE